MKFLFCTEGVTILPIGPPNAICICIFLVQEIPNLGITIIRQTYYWIRSTVRRPKYFYRPQTKFAKVMFSQVSVCRGGCLPHCMLDTTPLGRHPQAVHAGIWSTSGRYASHWNTSLFFFILVTIFRRLINLPTDLVI